MAMLVRPVCATCGKPCKPKNKSGKVYVHADYVAPAFEPNKTWAEIAAARRATNSDHEITIKMVTLIPSY